MTNANAKASPSWARPLSPSIKLLNLFRLWRPDEDFLKEAYNSTHLTDELWRMFVDYRIRLFFELRGKELWGDDGDMMRTFCVRCVDKQYDDTIVIYEQYLNEKGINMNENYRRAKSVNANVNANANANANAKAKANSMKLLQLFRTFDSRSVSEAYNSTHLSIYQWRMFVDYRIRVFFELRGKELYKDDTDMMQTFCVRCVDKQYDDTIMIYEMYLNEIGIKMNGNYKEMNGNYKVAQDGGGSRTTAEKPKWVSTGRKVTIQKRGSPAAQKTVFRNSVTKELRVRKATLSKDGTRRFAYVKF
jgi:hypothetical protein